MKKILTVLLLALLMAGVLALTGCSADEHDEALIGTWRWDLLSDLYYVFDADGSGYRDFGDGRDTFSWSTSGDRLNVNRDSAPSGERRNERWTYTISGNILTLDSQQEAGLVFSYIRD